MLLRLLAAAALLAAGAAQSCPPQCACAAGDELEYSCSLPSASLTLRARRRDYVDIDCEGGSLHCGELPALALGGNGSLASLGLRACALPRELRCVLRRLGAADVGTITLNDVSTPLAPAHFAGLHPTALLVFRAGAQSGVPSDVLAALPSLRHFRLCGANVSLAPLQFARAPPLRYLELATDGLGALPARAFEGLPALEVLNLWGNRIANVSEDAFLGLENLQELSLSTDGLHSLPPGLFAPTPRLRTLVINRNFLDELPAGLLGGLQHLQEVTISNDVELRVREGALAALPALAALTLERCALRSLPPLLLAELPALQRLSLAHNELEALPPGLLRALAALRTLDLSHNRLATLAPDTFAGLRALTDLRLDGNRIRLLPDQLFSGLRKLKFMSISHNMLTTISNYAFQGPEELESLNLANNNLTLLPLDQPGQYYNLELYSPLNALLKLRHLDLKRNNISVVFADWKNVMVFLKTLDLSWNRFTELTISDVQFLSSDVSVDLRHNNITTINLSTGYELQPSDDPPPASVILLDDNPIVCDCFLYAFVLSLRGFRSLTVEPAFDVGDARCAAPLQRYHVRSVPDTELVCNVANCSDHCGCDLRPATRTLELDCARDSPLPSPARFGLDRASLRLHRAPADLTGLPAYVTTLNLSGLGLAEVPFETVPSSLETLDLSDNRLSSVPPSLLAGNLSVRLAGNELECDCWRAERVGALLAARRVADLARVRCAGGAALAALDPARLCDAARGAAAGGALAALGALAAGAALLLWRYWRELRVLLWARGCCRRWLREEALDADKRYDVFVSFAHEDEAFVRTELLPRLEPRLATCVHYRDWAPGELIPLQIARSVERSRRTLIVVSRGFLRSAWGMLEFRAAHAQALKAGRARVVALLLEDVAGARMDRELRAYLATNTYVRADDPRCWDKLLYALPRGTASPASKTRGARGASEASPASKAGPASPASAGGLDVRLNAGGQLVNAGFVKDCV